MESESEAELSANQKTHYQSLSNLEQERDGGSRGKTGRGCETVPRSLCQVLQGLQRQQQKWLAWDDVTKQVGLQTGMYSSSEYSFIYSMFTLVRIMLLYDCSFLGFFRLSTNYRGVVSAETLPEKKKLRLAESEM